MDYVAENRMCVTRVLGLISLGSVVSFVALLSSLTVALPLKLLGVPPPYWFGTDYTDPRCAVVSGGAELFFLGLFSFAAGVILNRYFGMTARLDAFWLSNPVSIAVGLLVARQLVMNVAPPEFTAPVLFLLIVGWPVAWHLSLTGCRGGLRAKAIAFAAIYAIAFLTVGLVRVYPRYLQ